MWFSTPETGTGYKWYCGTTNVMTLTGAGNLTIGGVVYTYQPVPATTAEAVTVITKILKGIITFFYTTAFTLT